MRLTYGRERRKLRHDEIRRRQGEGPLDLIPLTYRHTHYML